MSIASGEYPISPDDSQCVSLPGSDFGLPYSEVWMSKADSSCIPTAKVEFVLRNGKRVLDNKAVFYLVSEGSSGIVQKTIPVLQPDVHMDRAWRGEPVDSSPSPILLLLLASGLLFLAFSFLGLWFWIRLGV